MFDLQNNDLDEDGPWSERLTATKFAGQSTYHNTLKSTPCQLVLGCDMKLNTPFMADLEDIRLVLSQDVPFALILW